MPHPIRSLPLAVIAGVFLLFQALAIGLGPGARVCFAPACADVVVAAAPASCCGSDCDEPAGLPDQAPPCGCVWLPIADEPVAELALAVQPLPAPMVADLPVLRLDPVEPARQGGCPPACRPPPHLASLRSIVLTC